MAYDNKGMNTAPLNPLESCDAVMIGLSRRYVIVWRDRPCKLQVTQPARDRVRDLQPGDEVGYNGEQDVVRSLAVYQ